MRSPRELKQLYKQGENISALLRKEQGITKNTCEINEVSYDLQAGSYVSLMKNSEYARMLKEFSTGIAEVIISLGCSDSILEAGVGEATTLSGVLDCFALEPKSYAFDLSWSRVAFARHWLEQTGKSLSNLCTGDLLNLPYLDNSVEVVYTSHSIEPNGGSEKPILAELYRVARKYLILLEPAYEFASVEERRRMDKHGYCKNLAGIARENGWKVIRHELFPVLSSPKNPTAIIVIQKESGGAAPTDNRILACPKYKTPLLHLGGMLYSPEALTVYPVIHGIPCLRIENGILASKFQEVLKNQWE